MQSLPDRNGLKEECDLILANATHLNIPNCLSLLQQKYSLKDDELAQVREYFTSRSKMNQNNSNVQQRINCWSPNMTFLDSGWIFAFEIFEKLSALT
jgi:hypothetical protein